MVTNDFRRLKFASLYPCYEQIEAKIYFVLWALNNTLLLYRGADKSLAKTRKETSSEAYRGRARFQQNKDVSCLQVSFLARQGAEGNSRHSDRNISLFPS